MAELKEKKRAETVHVVILFFVVVGLAVGVVLKGVEFHRKHPDFGVIGYSVFALWCASALAVNFFFEARYQRLKETQAQSLRNPRGKEAAMTYGFVTAIGFGIVWGWLRTHL